MKIKLFVIGLFLMIYLMFGAFAGETKDIIYTVNVSFEPNCVNEICVNETIVQTDNVTNITTNYTRETCSSVCYGLLKIEGVEGNTLTIYIDTSLEPWKNGSSQLVNGYKKTDLGNLSDISGIRQELQNLTSCFGRHLICTENLTECSTQKTNLDMSISSKNNKIDELNKKENDKYMWLVGGIILGIVGIKFILPSIQGKKNPKDPSTEQFPSNAGYK